MKFKICGHCKIPKLESGFHKDRRAKSGLQNQCKDCKAEYQREYRHSSTGRAAQNRDQKKQRLKFPEKEKARQAVKYAVHIGELKRSVFCEGCGLPAETQAHHPDYSKPLEVIWLCRPCHRKLHKSNK